MLEVHLFQRSLAGRELKKRMVSRSPVNGAVRGGRGHLPLLIGKASFSAFVSAYVSSAEDSSPLFPQPSLSAIALFAPLDIYASWRRYLQTFEACLTS